MSLSGGYMNVRQLMEALGWDRVEDGDAFKRQVLTELLERRAQDEANRALRQKLAAACAQRDEYAAELHEMKKLLGKA